MKILKFVAALLIATLYNSTVFASINVGDFVKYKISDSFGECFATSTVNLVDVENKKFEMTTVISDGCTLSRLASGTTNEKYSLPPSDFVWYNVSDCESKMKGVLEKQVSTLAGPFYNVCHVTKTFLDGTVMDTYFSEEVPFLSLIKEKTVYKNYGTVIAELVSYSKR